LGRGLGYAIAALVFSAIHFIRPENDAVLMHADPLAGARHLVGSFHLFLDPIAIIPGLFGLFLIGAVLCYAYEKTGNLWLSIGLHAGWIFGLKTIRVFGDYSRLDLGWVFGSSEPKIVSGPATWLGVLMVGLAIYKWPLIIAILKQARLSCRRSDAKFLPTNIS
jgi:membrane protease YdiL (CAAX protease family)